MPHAVHDAVFRDQPEEYALRATTVDGQLPPELRGTLLRNGPGRMQLGADRLNWFDGHALISGLSFDAGWATFRSRLVEAPLLSKERQANAQLKRRVFTNLPARWKNLFGLDLGNSAMHDVFAWGDGDALRVVAGNDPGHFALDPSTLATRGPERYGGTVKPGWDTGPMPCPDPHSGNLITWVKKPGLPDRLKFVEIDPRFHVVKETPWHKLGGGLAIVHDQRATARWYVTVEQGLRVSLPAALWGAEAVWDTLRPAQTATLLLVPRDGGPLRRVPLPRVRLGFHVINAFDDGDQLVADLVVYDGLVRFTAALPTAVRAARGIAEGDSARPTPTRFVIDTNTGEILSRSVLGPPGDAPEVSDAVLGRTYRFAYLAGVDDHDDVPDHGAYFYSNRLVKIDVTTGQSTTWSAGDSAVVSPPQFAARPGGRDEDDGWLLAWVLRDSGAEVVILDAQAMSPVATVRLGVHLPGVSHTRWSADVVLAPP
jgi:all-trans-8'-apo-beta-carotenal 15,15'-oxygenase